jgi:hypothetical protein
MGTIPDGFTLDSHYKAAKIRNKKYQHFTIADFLEFVADLDPNTPMWVEEYDEASDDLIIRPVECLSSNADKRYLLIG